MQPWFETFDPSLWLPEEETAAEQARFLANVLGLRRGDAVLDCPCGAGRIAVHLARMGCRVTGVDRSAEFVAKARRRFRREGLEGEFVTLDMRRIDFDAQFDAAINWSGSFGYFGDDENADLVRRYCRALRPGGRLIIDQRNRQRLLRRFEAVSGRGGSVVTHNGWDAAAQRLESRWVARRDGRRIASGLSIRLYTPAQMRLLLEGCGLAVMAMYGAADGSPYTRSSRRLIVTAAKPGN